MTAGRFWTSVFALLALALAILFVVKVWAVFIPFFFGFALAYFVQPIIARFEAAGMRRDRVVMMCGHPGFGSTRAEVGREADIRDALRRKLAQHAGGLRDGPRAIIDAGKQVRMEIDHTEAGISVSERANATSDAGSSSACRSRASVIRPSAASRSRATVRSPGAARRPASE